MFLGIFIQLFVNLQRTALQAMTAPLMAGSQAAFPVAVVLILGVMRQQTPPILETPCNFDSRSMPSDGALSFLQSFTCDLNNTCNAPGAPPNNEKIKAKARIKKLENKLNPYLRNPAKLDPLIQMKQSLDLMDKFDKILNSPDVKQLLSFDFRIGGFFYNETEIFDILTKTPFQMSNTTATELLNSRVNMSMFFNLAGYVDLKDVVCSPSNLSRFLDLSSDEVLKSVSKELCSINSSQIELLVKKVQSQFDLSKIFKLMSNFGNITGEYALAKASEDISAFLQLARSLFSSGSSTSNLITFMTTWFKDLLMLVENVNGQNNALYDWVTIFSQSIIRLDPLVTYLTSIEVSNNPVDAVNWSTFKRTVIVGHTLLMNLMAVQNNSTMPTSNQLTLADLLINQNAIYQSLEANFPNLAVASMEIAKNPIKLESLANLISVGLMDPDKLQLTICSYPSLTALFAFDNNQSLANFSAVLQEACSQNPKQLIDTFSENFNVDNFTKLFTGDTKVASMDGLQWEDIANFLTGLQNISPMLNSDLDQIISSLRVAASLFNVSITVNDTSLNSPNDVINFVGQIADSLILPEIDSETRKELLTLQIMSHNWMKAMQASTSIPTQLKKLIHQNTTIMVAFQMYERIAHDMSGKGNLQEDIFKYLLDIDKQSNIFLIMTCDAANIQAIWPDAANNTELLNATCLTNRNIFIELRKNVAEIFHHIESSLLNTANTAVSTNTSLSILKMLQSGLKAYEGIEDLQLNVEKELGSLFHFNASAEANYTFFISNPQQITMDIIERLSVTMTTVNGQYFPGTDVISRVGGFLHLWLNCSIFLADQLETAAEKDDPFVFLQTIPPLYSVETTFLLVMKDLPKITQALVMDYGSLVSSIVTNQNLSMSSSCSAMLSLGHQWDSWAKTSSMEPFLGALCTLSISQAVDILPFYHNFVQLVSGTFPEAPMPNITLIVKSVERIDRSWSAINAKGMSFSALESNLTASFKMVEKLMMNMSDWMDITNMVFNGSASILLNSMTNPDDKAAFRSAMAYMIQLQKMTNEAWIKMKGENFTLSDLMTPTFHKIYKIIEDYPEMINIFLHSAANLNKNPTLAMTLISQSSELCSDSNMLFMELFIIPEVSPMNYTFLKHTICNLTKMAALEPSAFLMQLLGSYYMYENTLNESSVTALQLLFRQSLTLVTDIAAGFMGEIPLAKSFGVNASQLVDILMPGILQFQSTLMPNENLNEALDAYIKQYLPLLNSVSMLLNTPTLNLDVITSVTKLLKSGAHFLLIGDLSHVEHLFNESTNSHRLWKTLERLPNATIILSFTAAFHQEKIQNMLVTLATVRDPITYICQNVSWDRVFVTPPELQFDTVAFQNDVCNISIPNDLPIDFSPFENVASVNFQGNKSVSFIELLLAVYNITANLNYTINPKPSWMTRFENFQTDIVKVLDKNMTEQYDYASVIADIADRFLPLIPADEFSSTANEYASIVYHLTIAIDAQLSRILNEPLSLASILGNFTVATDLIHQLSDAPPEIINRMLKEQINITKLIQTMETTSMENICTTDTFDEILSAELKTFLCNLSNTAQIQLASFFNMDKIINLITRQTVAGPYSFIQHLYTVQNIAKILDPSYQSFTTNDTSNLLQEMDLLRSQLATKFSNLQMMNESQLFWHIGSLLNYGDFIEINRVAAFVDVMQTIMIDKLELLQRNHSFTFSDFFKPNETANKMASMFFDNLPDLVTIVLANRDQWMKLSQLNDSSALIMFCDKSFVLQKPAGNETCMECFKDIFCSGAIFNVTDELQNEAQIQLFQQVILTPGTSNWTNTIHRFLRIQILLSQLVQNSTLVSQITSEQAWLDTFMAFQVAYNSSNPMAIQSAITEATTYLISQLQTANDISTLSALLHAWSPILTQFGSKNMTIASLLDGSETLIALYDLGSQFDPVIDSFLQLTITDPIKLFDYLSNPLHFQDMSCNGTTDFGNIFTWPNGTNITHILQLLCQVQMESGLAFDLAKKVGLEYVFTQNLTPVNSSTVKNQLNMFLYKFVGLIMNSMVEFQAPVINFDKLAQIFTNYSMAIQNPTSALTYYSLIDPLLKKMISSDDFIMYNQMQTNSVAIIKLLIQHMLNLQTSIIQGQNMDLSQLFLNATNAQNVMDQIFKNQSLVAAIISSSTNPFKLLTLSTDLSSGTVLCTAENFEKYFDIPTDLNISLIVRAACNETENLLQEIYNLLDNAKITQQIMELSTRSTNKSVTLSEYMILYEDMMKIYANLLNVSSIMYNGIDLTKLMTYQIEEAAYRLGVTEPLNPVQMSLLTAKLLDVLLNLPSCTMTNDTSLCQPPGSSVSFLGPYLSFMSTTLSTFNGLIQQLDSSRQFKLSELMPNATAFTQILNVLDPESGTDLAMALLNSTTNLNKIFDLIMNGSSCQQLQNYFIFPSGMTNYSELVHNILCNTNVSSTFLQELTQLLDWSILQHDLMKTISIDLTSSMSATLSIVELLQKWSTASPSELPQLIDPVLLKLFNWTSSDNLVEQLSTLLIKTSSDDSEIVGYYLDKYMPLLDSTFFDSQLLPQIPMQTVIYTIINNELEKLIHHPITLQSLLGDASFANGIDLSGLLDSTINMTVLLKAVESKDVLSFLCSNGSLSSLLVPPPNSQINISALESTLCKVNSADNVLNHLKERFNYQNILNMIENQLSNQSGSFMQYAKELSRLTTLFTQLMTNNDIMKNQTVTQQLEAMAQNILRVFDDPKNSNWRLIYETLKMGLDTGAPQSNEIYAAILSHMATSSNQIIDFISTLATKNSSNIFDIIFAGTNLTTSIYKDLLNTGVAMSSNHSWTDYGTTIDNIKKFMHLLNNQSFDQAFASMQMQLKEEFILTKLMDMIPFASPLLTTLDLYQQNELRDAISSFVQYNVLLDIMLNKRFQQDFNTLLQQTISSVDMQYMNEEITLMATDPMFYMIFIDPNMTHAVCHNVTQKASNDSRANAALRMCNLAANNSLIIQHFADFGKAINTIPDMFHDPSYMLEVVRSILQGRLQSSLNGSLANDTMNFFTSIYASLTAISTPYEQSESTIINNNMVLLCESQLNSILPTLGPSEKEIVKSIINSYLMSLDFAAASGTILQNLNMTLCDLFQMSLSDLVEFMINHLDVPQLTKMIQQTMQSADVFSCPHIINKTTLFINLFTEEANMKFTSCMPSLQVISNFMMAASNELTNIQTVLKPLMSLTFLPSEAIFILQEAMNATAPQMTSVKVRLSQLILLSTSVNASSLYLRINETDAHRFLDAVVKIEVNMVAKLSPEDLRKAICDINKLPLMISLPGSQSNRTVEFRDFLCNNTDVFIPGLLKTVQLGEVLIKISRYSTVSLNETSLERLFHLGNVLMSHLKLFEDIQTVASSLTMRNIPQTIVKIEDMITSFPITDAIENVQELVSILKMFKGDSWMTQIIEQIDRLLAGLTGFRTITNQYPIKIKVSDFFSNADEMKNELINTFRLTPTIVDEILNATLSSKELLRLALQVDLPGILCNSSRLEYALVIQKGSPLSTDVVSGLCQNYTESEVLNITKTLIAKANISSLISKAIQSGMTTMFKQYNIEPAKVKTLLSDMKTAQVPLKNLMSAMNEISEEMTFSDVEASNGSSVSNLGSMFCGQNNSSSNTSSTNQNSGSNLNRRKRSADFSEDIEGGENDGILVRQRRAAPILTETQEEICEKLVTEGQGEVAGKFLWAMMKSVMRGNILVTPNHPLVHGIITTINATLTELSNLKLLANTLGSNQASSLDSSTTNNMIKTLEDALKNPMMTTILQDSLGINPSDLLDSLKNISNATSTPISNSFTNILDSLGSMMDCISFDRFIFFSSKDDPAYLQSVSTDIFFAIEFDIDASTQKLPKHVIYTMRFPEARAKNTNFLHEIPFVLWPIKDIMTEMQYMQGFVQIQELIDRAIISAQLAQLGNTTNTTIDQVPKIEINQFPTDCINNNKFLRRMGHFTLFVLVVFSWLCLIITQIKDAMYERDNGLERTLHVMGARAGFRWTSWFVQNLISSLLVAALITLVIKFGKIFAYSNAFIVFLLLVDFSFAMIMYSFMIASFFNKASMASMFGLLFYFILYIPFSLVQSNALLPPDWAIKLTMVSAPTTVSWAGQYFTSFELKGTGFQWSDIKSEVFVVSVEWTLIALLLDGIGYFLIGWYIRNVFPGKFGVKQPFYFPFTSTYWGCRCGKKLIPHPVPLSKSNRNVEGHVNPAYLHNEPINTSSTKNKYKVLPNPANILRDNSSQNSGSTTNELSVTIRNLCKTYKGSKNVALNNLSLDLYQNEVTVLLGPNSAGKSTTINIITGLVDPSSGSVVVEGIDPFKNPGALPSVLGVCPQTNVFYDYMTVRNNLEYFAGFRTKLGRKERKEYVKDMLRKIGLDHVSNVKGCNLSGGQKRRLSVALAFLGDPKVVILDEPTSGVDPSARRRIWEMITSMKKGRSVLFCTHFMDEAEVIGDKIAVMKEGRLLVCDTPVSLKREFGCSYDITVTMNSTEHQSIELEANTLVKSIQESFPQASLRPIRSNEMRFIVPVTTQSTKTRAHLFTILEQAVDSLRIVSFTVEHTSLAQVFMKLIDDSDCDDRSSREHASSSGDITNQSFSSLVDSPSKNIGKPPSIDTIFYEPRNEVKRLWPAQMSILLKKRFLHYLRNWQTYVFMIIMPCLFVTAAMGLTYIKKVNSSEKLLLTPTIYGPNALSFYRNDDNSTLLEQEMVRYMLQTPAIGTVCMNDKKSTLSFVPCDASSVTPMSTVTLSVSEEWLYQNGSCVCNPSGFSNCPDKYSKGRPTAKTQLITTDILHMLDNTWQDDTANFILRANANAIIPKDNLWGGWEFLGLSTVPLWFNSKGAHTLPAYINAYSNMALRAAVTQSNLSQEYGISTYTYPIQQPNSLIVGDVRSHLTDVGTTVIILLAFCFIAATSVLYTIREKQNQEKLLQTTCGVSPLLYWTTSFLWDFLIFLIPIGLIILIMLAFQLPMFVDGISLLVVFIIFVLFACAALQQAYLLSRAFTSPAVGFMSIFSIGFFTGLILMIIITILVILVETTDEQSQLFIILQCIFSCLSPHFALTINLLIMIRENLMKNLFKTYGVKYTVVLLSLDKLGPHLIILGCHTIIFFTINMLCETSCWKNRKSTACCCTKCCSKKSNSHANVPHEEASVKAERDRINQYDYKIDDPLIISNVSKRFFIGRKKLQAMNKVTFGMNKGECFGLVGANGAGKTTTFKIITGLLSPDSGTLSVLPAGGPPIGYCPQENPVDPQLTIAEHLDIYAKLRGVQDPQFQILAIIQGLGLDPHVNKRAKNLSSGTKRKLSLGLALLGCPQLILLDEPTSGMDPVSKRRMWRLLDRVRHCSSLLLTSHSMEEVEAICSRLAIMVSGEFKCLGSMHHLRSEYGASYTLQVWCEPHKMNEIETYLSSKFPGTKLKSKNGKLAEFSIPLNVKLSELYLNLDNHKDNFCIVDFDAFQTTLEQIFLHFSQNGKSDAEPRMNDSNSNNFYESPAKNYPTDQYSFL